jgi:hypothetical protein
MMTGMRFPIWVLLAVFSLVAVDSHAAKKQAKKMAKPVAVPPGRMELFSVTPRGVQRGMAAILTLHGTNITSSNLKFSNDAISGKLLEEPGAGTNLLRVEITAAATLTRGRYELWLKRTNAETSKVAFYVDDLPQAAESTNASVTAVKPPVSFWGTLARPAESASVEFEANAGAMLVFDASARSIGSTANLTLSLFDSSGRLIAANNGYDGGDPLLAMTVPAKGRYRLRIGDRTDAGSAEHFYRVSIGDFPVVTGCYPLGVASGKRSAVELLGVNVPDHAEAFVEPKTAGEIPVPFDMEKFRSRKPLKVIASAETEMTETEPNDDPGHAMDVPFPAIIEGRFSHDTGITSGAAEPGADVDLFRFNAVAGHSIVIETDAASRGSPVDTKIEVLHPDGKPVQRLQLQAVRDSHVTFKQIDSVTDDIRVENWQEMELRQYMYLNGEVCRIFRMPQGPDSGFQFFNIGGKRRNYFDTSPVAHALDESCYVVEPRAVGEKLTPNGLPVFPVYYVNDDDASRKNGGDSWLMFQAPTNGAYLVRVSDSRGFSGDRFAYRLLLRESKPDFSVSLGGANPMINAGSAKDFTLSASRMDDFDEDITVTAANVPEGIFVTSPVVIQSGHLDARGAVFIPATNAAAVSASNFSQITFTATASVNGKNVSKPVNGLGKITIAAPPKLFIALEPYDMQRTNYVHPGADDPPMEITIAPGQSIPAGLKVHRNGFDELITFTVENLPHGVIVDNIGLNGVLIPKGESARQIFLTAAKWVPDTDRLCFAKSNQAGNQVSMPLLLHVRKKQTLTSTR